jgi:3-deoxy-D-arabino-heptulosonate 7-phosphate (DAHP) synthase
LTFREREAKMSVETQKRELSEFGLVEVVEPISSQYVNLIVSEPRSSRTLKEKQLTSEYLKRSNGEPRIILCQKRVGGAFDDSGSSHKFVFDIGMLTVEDLSHLAMIPPGADKLMIEVHLNPTQVMSDAAQLLTAADFSEIIGKFKVLAHCSCDGIKT